MMNANLTKQLEEQLEEQLEALKENLPAALAIWQQTNGAKTTLGWIHAANPKAISDLLADYKQLLNHMDAGGDVKN